MCKHGEIVDKLYIYKLCIMIVYILDILPLFLLYIPIYMYIYI